MYSLNFLLISDAVELLVSFHDASINKGAGEGKTTPLHYAVQGGHEDCVQLLLEAGAKVNALTFSEGEHLSPLDLCDPDTPIHNMLTQHGGLPGSEVTSTAQPQQDEDPSALPGDETDGKPDVATLGLAGEATISIPSLRPTTPSRRSFVNEPIFEGVQSSSEYAAASPPQLSRVATPVTPPPASQEALRQGPGILKRMFSMMKKKPSQVPPDSITSSVVGFYAAQMTLLAAAVIGE